MSVGHPWRGASARAVLALCLASLGAPARAQTIEDLPPGVRLAMETRAAERVVGGEDASIDVWPSIVSLRGVAPADWTIAGAPIHYCGGTVIAPDWVLTAAHCVAEHVNETQDSFTLTPAVPGADGRFAHPLFGAIELVLGVDDLADEGAAMVHRAAEVVIHPDYEPIRDISDINDAIEREPSNDVALIRLDAPWPGAVMPLSPDRGSDPSTDAPVYVAGFGARQEAAGDNLRRFTRAPSGLAAYAGSRTLRQAAVPVVDGASCSRSYPQHDDASRICAGYNWDGVDSCQGDSGGPLVKLDDEAVIYQVGVVSFGRGCAKARAYGVYTRISAFADWIDDYAPEAFGATFVAAPASETARETLEELLAALAPAEGRAAITLKPTADFKLGDLMTFEITPTVSGRLVVLDLHTNGEVVQIFPNQLSSTSAEQVFAAGETVTFPGANFPFQFRATTTEAAGRILAIVVPPDFPTEATLWSDEAQTKGFGVEPRPANFQLNLAAEIVDYSARAAGPEAPLPGFAMAIAPYRITE